LWVRELFFFLQLFASEKWLDVRALCGLNGRFFLSCLSRVFCVGVLLAPTLSCILMYFLSLLLSFAFKKIIIIRHTSIHTELISEFNRKKTTLDERGITTASSTRPTLSTHT